MQQILHSSDTVLEPARFRDPYARVAHDEFAEKLAAAGFSVEERRQIDFAYDLAKFAHRFLDRKDGERHFEHVKTVALILLDEAGVRDARVLCTALLHDTVEDSWIFGSSAVRDQEPRETARWRLERVFDTEVADAVLRLSKLPKTRISEQDATNHERYMEGITRGGYIVHLVKMADRLQNLRSMAGTSADFIARQVKETEEEYLPMFREIAERAGPSRTAFETLLSNIEIEVRVLRKGMPARPRLVR